MLSRSAMRFFVMYTKVVASVLSDATRFLGPDTKRVKITSQENLFSRHCHKLSRKTHSPGPHLFPPKLEIQKPSNVKACDEENAKKSASALDTEYDPPPSILFRFPMLDPLPIQCWVMSKREKVRPTPPIQC